MRWLLARRDAHWGRTPLTLTRAFSWCCLLTVYLALVLGQGFETLQPQNDSYTRLKAESTSEASDTNVDHTVSSLGGPQNFTGAVAPLLPSPRGEQDLNGGSQPTLEPRSSTPANPPGPEKGAKLKKYPLRRCCPQGHVTRETGECVPAVVPVLNLTRLVGRQACGEDLSLVEPVTCSLEEQEVRVLNITSRSLLCIRGHAFLLHKGVKSDFCVGIGEDGREKALSCKPKPNPDACHTQGQAHVNKCCYCGMVMDTFNCAKYEANMNTSASSEKPWADPLQKWASEKGLSVRPNEPRCRHGRHFIDSFHFESDGRLYTQEGNFINDDAYCLDYDLYENKTMRLRAEVCIEVSTVWQRIRFSVLPIGFSISVVFLSVTLFFHFAVPELRQGPRLYLIGYMLMLLVSDVLLLIVQLFAKLLHQGFCTVIGYMILYFTISTFCWLTVICTDVLQVARTFCCYNVKLITSHCFTNKKNLTIYSIFAFGFPLVLCIIAVVMQFCFLENTSLIRPNFGKTTCFFELHDRRPRMLYYDLPAGVLFFVCLVQLAVAIYKISHYSTANKYQGITNSSPHPEEKRISFFRDFLCSLLDTHQSKLPIDNSGKLETEDNKGQVEVKQDMTGDGTTKGDLSAYKEKTKAEESSLSKEKILSAESTELQSKGETSCNIHDEDHKQGQQAERQTISFMEKSFKKSFRFKVFILMLITICWATEVASGFIKPEEIWVFTDVLNTLQGFFQFLLFVRNPAMRNLCRQRYPAFFAKIDAVESTLTKCCSFKSCCRTKKGERLV